MRFDTVFVIGCGGIGSHILQPLVRLMAHHENGAPLSEEGFVLIDGDQFEEKNATRQLFPMHFVGRNKAEAMAHAMEIMVPGFRPTVIPTYIREESLLEEIEVARQRHHNVHGKSDWTPLIVVGVDNEITRKMVLDAVDRLELPNFVVIDAANDFDHGSVVSYVRHGHERVTADPREVYPNIGNPQDKIPEGCSELIPSSPQLIVANMGAAWMSLLIIQALLDGQEWSDTVRFQCRTMRAFTETDMVRL